MVCRVPLFAPRSPPAYRRALVAAGLDGRFDLGNGDPEVVAHRPVRRGEQRADVVEAAGVEQPHDGQHAVVLGHHVPDVAAQLLVVEPVQRGAEVEHWGAIKAAAADAVIAAGGTITHHHAVGRDHRPWYDRQRPEPFADAMRAAKAAVDPRGLLNPGVLFDAG